MSHNSRQYDQQVKHVTREITEAIRRGFRDINNAEVDYKVRMAVHTAMTKLYPGLYTKEGVLAKLSPDLTDSYWNCHDCLIQDAQNAARTSIKRSREQALEVIQYFVDHAQDYIDAVEDEATETYWLTEVTNRKGKTSIRALLYEVYLYAFRNYHPDID